MERRHPTHGRPRAGDGAAVRERAPRRPPARDVRRGVRPSGRGHPAPGVLADLDGTLDMATWAYGVFVLVFAVFLLPAARLADRCGRRPVFLTGTALFTLASPACALAPSMGSLTAARAAEGLGAAMAEPAAFAFLSTAFPGSRRNVRSGLTGVPLPLPRSAHPSSAGSSPGACPGSLCST
ncbi:MFS transporter [Actinomadura geliboluensis]|uniref:MFS transporter n=1 Tax=Actinomadura geliboluensis TaxID=882440 RepID=UPI0036963D21